MRYFITLSYDGGRYHGWQVQHNGNSVQAEMEKVQEELEDKVVEGTAGGGAVTATANGKKEILSLKISPDAVDPEDIETLEDLVMVAVNDAVKKADDMMAEGMSAVTGGINIPGLF